MAILVLLIALITPGATPPATASDAEATDPTSRLARRLAERLRDPALRQDQTGVAVLALPGEDTIFAHQSRLPLRPASTIKILTGAAALALLGPEFVFTTRFYAQVPIDGHGTLDGDLYIQGRGAPDLVAESWWLMAHRLAALGLQDVTGRLVADASYFDDAARPPGWPPPGAGSWYNAPVGALSCNFNVVEIRVEPAPFPGERPGVTLEPIGSYFKVVNRARTVDRTTRITVERRYHGGQNTLVVKGPIRAGGEAVAFHRAVEGAALYALHAFREFASGEGIRIHGPLATGTVPEAARLLHRHDSRPLAMLVRDMNKNSNNFMAEALVKTLGAERVAVPGTTAAGVAVVRDYLTGLGLDTSGARIADGSGLSDEDRVPAGLLAGLLARVHRDFAIGPELLGSLPIAGADGTLNGRLGGEEARRRVRAKTGRVNGAVALAGYVTNRDGRAFAFAILANRPRGSAETTQRAIDALVEAIASSTDDDLQPAGFSSGP